MAVTIADVARHAGVSIKSVSNYLNDYPFMSDAMRARIAASVEALDYKVNASARGLRLGRTGSISLVVPELAQPYFAQLAEDVVVRAEHHGLHVSIEMTGADPERELAYLAGDRGPQVDGLIMHAVGLARTSGEVTELRYPTVLIGDEIAAEGCDFVTMAHEAAAAAAVGYLAARGRTRIVALGAERESDAPSGARLRLDGYRRGLEVAGLAADPELLVPAGLWRIGSGRQGIEALIDAGVEFDGVVGFNDSLALGAISALTHAGLDVPGDVSVIGFDDIDEAPFASPPLTTADPSRHVLASTAVDLLVERIEGESGPARRVEAPFRIVERASV